MSTKHILIAALLASAFAPALADELDTEPVIVTRTGNLDLRLANVAALAASPGVIHLQGKLVRNAPYSAEMVSERIQTLGDGNQIVNKSSSMSYRDSAGRTRVETRGDDGELRTVTISDPVAGARYVLRPRDKSAVKVPAPGAAAVAAREQARSAATAARAAAAEARAAGADARGAAEKAREKIEELRREGKLGGNAGERVIVKQVERSGAANGEFKDVQIRIAQVASGDAMGSRIGAALAGSLGEGKYASKAETRDLGSREFNGVKANGVQRSYEIPAGEIGNRQPIVVSTETWTSPELQAVVYQKRSDPRAGDTVLRLESLSRSEPAAALFTVPPDYTVKEPASVTTTRIEKK